MNETAEFVIRHGYAVLFFWVLAEQGALPVPSIPLLLVCGALVKSGHLSGTAVVFHGPCGLPGRRLRVVFQIGGAAAQRVLAFLCRLVLEPDSCVRQTEGGFARYGVRFLLVSKSIPGMNALAAPLAGERRR